MGQTIPAQGLISTGLVQGSGPLLLANGTAAAPTYSFSSDPDTGIYGNGAGAVIIATDSSLAYTFNAHATGIGWANDTFLARDAANVLAMKSGVTAQEFRVYNTFTDASNYERMNIRWSSNVVYFETAAAGTGTNRSMQIGTLGVGSLLFMTNGTERLTINGAGTAWTIASATSITFPDACNFVFNATTGTKIGTAGSQKMGFYGATPVVQPTGVAVSAAGIHAALVTLGLITA